MHMAHKHNNPAHFGIRTKEYKLIFFYGRDYKNNRDISAQKWADNLHQCPFLTRPLHGNFYDLRNDHEMNNLYGQNNFQEVIKNLKGRLKELRQELKEDDSKFPEIKEVIDSIGIKNL